jgi:hypothetical protein
MGDRRRPGGRAGRASATGVVAAVVVLLALVLGTGCKNMPGADGQYATHDHGDDNRPH